jgi:hypothetical protein
MRLCQGFFLYAGKIRSGSEQGREKSRPPISWFPVPPPGLLFLKVIRDFVMRAKHFVDYHG